MKHSAAASTRTSSSTQLATSATELYSSNSSKHVHLASEALRQQGLQGSSC